jgi:hypothetical protein
MFKKLLVLLLVGCLTLLIGFKTLASNTADLGNNHDGSSLTINATIDTYDPLAAATSDSNQAKSTPDNWDLQYRSHHQSSGHHHGHWDPDSREMMLLAFVGVMIIAIGFPRYHH